MNSLQKLKSIRGARTGAAIFTLAVGTHFAVQWFLNRDFPAGYTYSTPASEVAKTVRLSEESVVFITGANTGIGLETARALYGRGGKVIMGCRSPEKCKAAMVKISSKENDDRLVSEQIDLSDLDSVRDCAKRISDQYDRLDILICNAGIMALPEYSETKQGFEKQFGVNHVGHYYLTRLLTPLMAKTDQSRVVVVASEGHNRGPDMNEWLSDIESEANKSKATGPLKSKYFSWTNYGFSKASNILFARELNRRYSKPEQGGIRAISLHPGVIMTELARHMPGWQQSIASFIGAYSMKSVEAGAATQTLAALMDYSKIDGGYMTDCGVHNHLLRSDIRENKDSMDQRLWKVTEEMIEQRGYSFDL